MAEIWQGFCKILFTGLNKKLVDIKPLREFNPIMHLRGFFFFICCASFLIAPHRLLADELYSAGVRVSQDASENIVETAENLAEWLEKATGKKFGVSSDEGGIVLAVDPDDPALAGQASQDAFAVNAGPEEVHIVGRTGMALENGVHWWLDKLGFRWLHASDKWTIVPELSDLRMDIDTVQAPVFRQRDFFGTGGFGRPAMDPKQKAADQWQQFQRRNLLTGRHPDGIRLGGHAGEAFVERHKDALRANPDLLAMTDGRRQDLDEPRVPIKLNVGNPELQQMWVQDRLEQLRRDIERNPATIAVSVDPSDGGRHCESPESLAIGNGSPSDQVFYLANLTARAVAEEFPDKFVNLYAYNEHAELPSFPLEPNMIVSIIPYGFQTTGRTPEEFIEAWKDVAPVLGLYDYWEIPDWTRNLPRLGPQTITDRVRLWHENGVELFFAESTYAGGSMGPNWYLASRLLWNPEKDANAILDDYFLHSFGEARGPVREMYDRWGDRFIHSEHEIAMSLSDLDRALGMTEDPEIRARLVDLARYLHYVALWYDYQQTKPKTPERTAAAEAVVNYLWRIYDSNMVQVFRLAQLLNRDDAPHLEHLHMDNPMWAETPQLTDEEILVLFREDLKKYQTLDFEPVSFGSPLIPLVAAPSIADSPNIETGRFGMTATFQFTAPEGMTSIPIEVQVGKVSGPDKFDELVLWGPSGEETFRQRVANDKEGWQEVTLPTMEPGVYTMEVRDRKNTFRLKIPEGLPFVNTKDLTATDMSGRLFFYVPAGTEQIALHNPGVLPLKIYNPEGDLLEVPANEEHKNMFLVDVPEGQDAKAWSLDQFKGWDPLVLLNCPNNFAWSAEMLMVPVDAR